MNGSRLELRAVAEKRLIAGLLLGCAIVLSGCSGKGSSGASDHGAVDPRVESAIVQIPGTDSHYDALWVGARLSSWRVEGIRSCLEQNGRKDLWPRAEEAATRHLQIPDFRAPSPKMLTEVGLDWRRAPDANATVKDSDLVLWDCADAGPDEIPTPQSEDYQKFENLQYAWGDELDKVLDDPRYNTEKQTVNDCLIAGGATVGKNDAGETAHGWEGQFSLGAASLDAMTDENSKEAGKLMVTCAEPLWKQWQEALDEPKEQFVEQHAAELAHLSKAVE